MLRIKLALTAVSEQSYDEIDFALGSRPDFVDE